MIENKYSKLFHKTYSKILKQKGSEIKNFLIDQKKKHKTFNKQHNLILQNLEAEIIEQYYINSSGLFNQLLYIYNKRYDEYEEAHVNLIFNDLYDCFKLIEGIKKDFSYNDIIIELASVEAINETHRLFRNSSRIAELMYENDDLNKFSLMNINGDIENDEIFREQRWKKINRDKPGIYKNQAELENKELEDLISFNKHVYGDIKKYVGHSNDGKSKSPENVYTQIKNFNLNEVYEKDFKLMYEDFIVYYIDSKKTSYEDYENVLFKNWDEHNSFIVFSCPPQEAALLLFKLMEFFSDLNYTNIGASKVFKTKSGSKITSTNYGQRVAPFNPKSGNFNLSAKQIGMLKKVESIIDLIKIETFKS